MSKIIDIEGRLQVEKKKKANIEKAKKLEEVRRVMQCSRCLARCSKCGVQFETQDIYKRHKGPYRFCSACEEEYEEFLRLKESGEASPYYWHNQQWMDLWQSWMNFQEALQRYIESPEFIELLREVDWHR
ncbi:MAG: hypothetical protein BZ151_09650 [Desulfobacca sp. 4484_104]|nr:MAG: hypothetical protein BZ151_09650 [Desulfobacca sp. 4484_104]RLA89104.1 MAG: hypothetical protein DRG58_06115 [Deltaproteobacteria bacterium]